MADSPAPLETRRPRRWGRRLAIGFLSLAGLTAGLAAAAWTWRVDLVHHFLTDPTSVWQVRLQNVEWSGGGLVIKDFSVRHADQAEPVFAAASLRSAVTLRALMSGQLGKVTVEKPRVHWRAGLRADPLQPTKPAAAKPLLTWDSLLITDGSVDVAEAGFYSFKGSLAGQSGPGAWHEEGRLALAGTTLTSRDAEYTMTLTEGPVRTLKVNASQVETAGSLDAASGALVLTSSSLAGARVQLGATAPSPALPARPDPAPAADSGGPSIISGTEIKNLTAPGLQLEAALPWLASSRGDLALAHLTSGTGVPTSLKGLQFSAASARLPAEASLPDFSLSASVSGTALRLENVVFKNARVPDLNGLFTQLGWPGIPQLAASFEADGTFSSLQAEAGVPTSSAEQHLTFRDLKAALPGQGTLSASRVVVAAVPDEVIASRRLRRLEVEGWQADLTIERPSPALLADAGAAEAGAAEASADPPAASGLPVPAAARPLWEGWSADHLTASEGPLKTTLPQLGGARITASLSISTPTPGSADVPAAYQINLREPQMVHPDLPEQPMALASAIQFTATVTGLWQKREIDSLTIGGTRLQIGDALFRMISALPPTPPPAPAALESETAPKPPSTSSTRPANPAAPPWRIKSVVLDDSLVRIDNLGAGSRLDIPIKRQEFHDLPLDTEALAAVERVYKIEVPSITLYNPFSVGQKVAVLDTNYIQFTPSGLLKRQIQRVDLMAPSLYAGQPLFDFVDAARRRFARLASARPASPPDQPMLVDNASRSPTVLSALASVTPAAVAGIAEWDIPFYTASGKVLVAPKGFPWPNLPVIPFRNARDAQGTPIPFHLHGESFHGELAIEPGWYDFPEYKVRLRLSDRGRIIFNTPQKDQDNNLTEVFENNTLIFRQLEISGTWLSITYDAHGIYARFGGMTCGGDLTGGFNLYLDELYTWDAWISMTGIGMQSLTDKLTPDTFRMSGPVDELSVKAYGDTTTLYQAVLALKVSRPGLLHLLALDQLKDRIDALGGMSADLGRISLASLRDFAYTGCTGGLKLFGTEGEGHLRLTGPAGSRTFNLRLHDYRAKTPRIAAPF